MLLLFNSWIHTNKLHQEAVLRVINKTAIQQMSTSTKLPAIKILKFFQTTWVVTSAPSDWIVSQYLSSYDLLFKKQEINI